MANQFEFYFKSSDLQELINTGAAGILVTAKVTFVSPDLSKMEIAAQTFGEGAVEPTSAKGCPMPCVI